MTVEYRLGQETDAMRILLFYDNFIRDFRGLLLLREMLGRRGHDVRIDPLWDEPIDAIRAFNPDTVVMGQIGEKTTCDVGRFVHDSRINLVLNTTENVCYEARKPYFFKANFREWNTPLIDMQVIISHDFHRFVQDHSEIGDKAKYHHIGCPRFDLSVHPEICALETADVREKYGLDRFDRKLLYISSFIFDDAGGQASDENLAFIDIPVRLKREMAQKRQHHGIITRLLKDLADTNGVLLIKRHPWDKSTYYDDHYAGDRVILVDNHDYIVPLLQVSDAMLHTESTVAIEGWIQGKKTVSILPDFDGDRRKLKNHMTHEPVVTDYGSLCAVLADYPWERTRRSLENYQPFIDGQATRRLADRLSRLAPQPGRRQHRLTNRARERRREQRRHARLTYADRLRQLPSDQYLHHFLHLEQYRRRIEVFYDTPIRRHMAVNDSPAGPGGGTPRPDAILTRAQDRAALDDHEGALGMLDSLVGGTDDGCGGHAHWLAARCRWQEREAGRARRHFEQALTVAPDDTPIRTDFARFLLETGDTPATVRQCQQVLDRRPDDIDILMLLSDVAQRAGKSSLANDLAGRVLAMEPSHPEAVKRMDAADAGPGGAGHAYRSIDADADLGNLAALGRRQRFGHWAVRFRGLTIRCHDLLSFYTAAKDIFLHRIYDFEAVRPDPVVIDGGGHIGLFTLCVKQKYPRARVTVFEPDGESLALLRANLSANGCDDVTIVPSGLYNRDGRVRFGSDNSDGSSIFSPDADTRVSVVRLGPYLGAGIDYLKLNIEGAESEVLGDVAGQLGQVRELVLEYHGFPETGQCLHRILALLDQKGFRYLVNDFDAHTNPATKPPFRIDKASRFFLLVYARRLFDPAPEPAAAGADDAERTDPVSRQFGYDRGKPIDRHYIEGFLDRHREHICGRVLEIGDAGYTRRYGSGVTRTDVLNAVAAPGVTVVGDLADGAGLAADTYDCIVLTQTIQFIYDVTAAIGAAVRALRPGGRLLITASGISQISRYDMDRWGEFWRFTDRSLERLLREAAPACHVQVAAHGNVAAAKAFLDGRAHHELPPAVLDVQDPDYPVVLTATVRKPPVCRTGAGASARPAGPTPVAGPSVLLYHRVAEDPVDAQLLAVSPAYFEAHLRDLSARCQVVGLDRIIDAVDAGTPADEMVAITFDDGYADNLIHALPVIEAAQVPVTVFVTSGGLDAPQAFWWDALAHLFFEGALPETIDICLEGTPKVVPTQTPRQRFDAYERLCGRLRNASPATIRRRLPDIFVRAGRPLNGYADHRRLRADELKRLAQSPWVEIGAHSVNHPRLSTLTPEAQMREIYLSKRQLEEITGEPVRFFSYPFGAAQDFTQTTADIARECGFAGAVANIQGRIAAPVDRYRVPRRLVRNWSGATFHRWLPAPDGQAYEAAAIDGRNRRLGAALQAVEKGSADVGKYGGNHV
jgi:surface carbohydrate biosynthesis protein/FkbM family methyltransferase